MSALPALAGRCARLAALAFGLIAATLSPTLHAASLPDTGQDLCYTGSAADAVPANSPSSVARDAGSHPRQDCRFGRDPANAAGALTKVGGGAAGFDYTKIANNGSTLTAGAPLGATAGDWACTKDNLTGLTWEVKTAGPVAAEPRSILATYTWYNSNPLTNGGIAGTVSGGTCQTAGTCDTEKFTALVNALGGSGLCGFSDWRLPSLRELQSLVHAGSAAPTIDPTYFPNTQTSAVYWSGSAYVPLPSFAWFVSFVVGNSFPDGKTNGVYVRLVRGGQF